MRSKCLALANDAFRDRRLRTGASQSYFANYEPGGRGFKSCRARQINNGLLISRPFFFDGLRPIV